MTHRASSARTEGRAPRWFGLVRIWTTAPVLAVIVGVGYALGHVVAGGIFAAVYVLVGVVFGRWARGNRARIRERLKADPSYRQRYNERSDRIGRFLGWYFAALGALLVIVVIAWVIARLARSRYGRLGWASVLE